MAKANGMTEPTAHVPELGEEVRLEKTPANTVK